MATAPYFSWYFSSKKGFAIRCAVVVVFIVAMVLCAFSPKLYTRYYLKVSSSLGVFAMLFVCDILAKKIFHQNIGEVEAYGENKTQAFLEKLVKNISYASMACYMFHRFFFWAGEKLWNPALIWLKWVYMACLVFPFMLILSYYIQKGYDILVDRLNNNKCNV